MHVVVVSPGRFKAGPEHDLFERYRARCPWRVELVEPVLKRDVAAGQRRAAESRLIAHRLPPGRPVVVLDETGELATTEAFARRLGRWRDDGVAGVSFVIGGAEGLDAELRERADWRLALGRLTWPHLLVRALLAEQLYRAASVLAGHPYHRGAGEG
ncbi:MAG: 23S rRNA (pseudouridine(1915)-N(3))-methyltransferase RlmH [Alphaproteobacteria bacterium]|nr:23S rRNA (pseudouridine(1915)-N(3))-methyltransferase RlmH [Alphaproteobacteria bacterium]